MISLNPNRRRDQWIYQISLGALLVVLWTFGGFLWPRILPFPWLIVEAFTEQTFGGPMGEALYFALRSILVGYLIAVLVGVISGLAMGLNDLVEQFLDPYLDALYAMPFPALIPAMIMWFGTGEQIRIIVVFFFAYFPIAINTLEGVQSIPARYTELSESFDAGRLFRIRHIVLPHGLPYILAGLRLGSGMAVKGLVITELLVAVTGFGQLITEWSSAFRMEGVFSVVFVLMALGIGATWLLKQVERLAISWDVSAVEE